MEYIIVIMIGYLLGTSSMSYYIGKFKDVDINKNGSKNLGASNTMALIGWKAGVIVALHDILKAYMAVILLRMLYPDLPYVGELAGVSCILGHIFPFYLHFKGGKGFASYFGMTLAIDWKFALCLALVLIFITVVTDYIVIATFTTMVAVPVYHGLFHSLIGACIMLIASMITLYKHKENVDRLLNGTEVGLRSANKGEHRMK